VPQNFINGNKVKSIDFGVDYQAVRAAEGNRVGKGEFHP